MSSQVADLSSVVSFLDQAAGGVRRPLGGLRQPASADHIHNRAEVAEKRAAVTGVMGQRAATHERLAGVAVDIDPLAPMFGEGLGLDSIDILEIALALSKTYGVRLRSDDRNNLRIFASLRSLHEHIRKLQRP